MAKCLTCHQVCKMCLKKHVWIYWLSDVEKWLDTDCLSQRESSRTAVWKLHGLSINLRKVKHASKNSRVYQPKWIPSQAKLCLNWVWEIKLFTQQINSQNWENYNWMTTTTLDHNLPKATLETLFQFLSDESQYLN